MSEITPERLRSLFRPRSVALVGASDKSMFSQLAFGNLTQFGFLEHTHLVNPRNDVVHDRPAVARIADIEEPVDVAFLQVPQAVTLDALTEAAEAGVRNAVILSSGYGEAGADGKRAEAELVAHAERLGMLVLGPNHLGFANFVDQIPVTSIPGLPRRSGPIALLSQSGASSSAMLDFATMSGNDLSYMVTLGNEAMITAGHALEFFVQDESTRAIAIFMETVRQPEVFRRAALAALEAGKAVVVLKAGSSQLAARTAAAHTGALVGDDRTVDAMFRDLGVIRVDTIEDMLITAGLAAHTGPLGEGGLGIASISGGACDIIADRAEDGGVALPEIGAPTRERLGEIMPGYGTIQNPLDVTGAAVIDPSIFTRSVVALAEDPAIAVVAAVTGVPWQGEGPWQSQYLVSAIGAGAQAVSKPVLIMNQIQQPVTAYTKEILEIGGVPGVVGGLGQAVTAFGGLFRWSERRREHLAELEAERLSPGARGAVSVELPAERSGAWSEHVVRGVLAQAGIPIVPAVLAGSEDEAVEAAARLETPVALKIASPDILHKSDIGGVRLNVTGEDAVRAAYRAVRAAGETVDGARLEGVLVSPMRSGGVELLVGAVRDPDWGAVLAIALGGVFVEVFEDSVLTQVPVSPARVRQLLRRLKAAPLLDGVRGGTPADVDRLSEVISAIGDLVHALGDDLESLEVNPLRVDGGDIEALDALVTWRAGALADAH
ncbi:acetate--CoA ligase family protein [Microbacterium sp. No. 7]|uniref:acetate--CoA ligase family protein n=1 Tax=Microbacterium sp. No. 7 TaxID=1714373 RepID=UPI0018D1F241|nr:acetate--CoA ligase family protein [Microbacterium sp. No. 7]